VKEAISVCRHALCANHHGTCGLCANVIKKGIEATGNALRAKKAATGKDGGNGYLNLPKFRVRHATDVIAADAAKLTAKERQFFSTAEG
jgi:hypothetical protein